MIKLVILDRDGVINFDSPDYIKSPEEWHAIPGSLEAIARLHRANIKVAVATNQSGVARNYYDLAMLKKIHESMLDQLKTAGGYIDKITFCPHHPDDHCECRKPKPGMLLEISKYLNIDLKNAVMIGDAKRDMEAAITAGAKGIFIDAKHKNNIKNIFADIPVFENLSQAADAILNNDLQAYLS
jgi:D-glycero-D-manno-heptose 1,7-bisphosphate phosphatase